MYITILNSVTMGIKTTVSVFLAIIFLHFFIFRYSRQRAARDIYRVSLSRYKKCELSLLMRYKERYASGRNHSVQPSFAVRFDRLIMGSDYYKDLEQALDEAITWRTDFEEREKMKQAEEEKTKIVARVNESFLHRTFHQNPHMYAVKEETAPTSVDTLNVAV